MPSAHESSMVAVATRRMSENPEMAAVVAEYCRRLNGDEFDKEYIETICQRPWGEFDFYEAWGFAQVHTLVCSGAVVTGKVYVGCGPASDKAAKENRKRLSNLPSGFGATFESGTADEDGHLTWTREIELGQTLPDGLPIKCRVGPRSIPLEVGYTRVSRTLLHLNADGGVARWPYGQDWITIFLNRNAVSTKPSE